MKRTNSRIKAMFTLYNYDLINELIDNDSLNDMVDDDEISFDEEFYKELVDGVTSNLKEINLVFNRNLKDWSIDRLNIVDRALIRIAIYEMLYTNTPKNIIINEILNITHEYSELENKKESRFNNKLLDSIARSINAE